MSGYGSMSEGKGRSQQTTQQDVWQGQSGFLQNLYQMAQGLATGQQGGAGATSNAAGDVLQRVQPTWRDLLNPTGNTALTGAIDASAGDVTRNLTRNILPALRDTAIGGGGLGGSRGAIAAGLAGGDAADAIARTSAGMRSGAYEGDQQRRLAAVGLGPALAEAQAIPGSVAWRPIQNFAGALGNPVVLGRSQGTSATDQWAKAMGGGAV
jgi:hypothetical protein